MDLILFCCGLMLAAGEIYKQLFLYYHINNRIYDWWFFPFQLCSIPMYLCLLLPFLTKLQTDATPSQAGSSLVRTTVRTFLQDYTLLGGIAALAVPEGFSHIHWSLTVHGYAWHILLIIIGLFVWICGKSDLSHRGFFRTIPVFIICCAIATAINVLSPGRDRADMFYISPYHPNVQPVFHLLALHLGIHIANLIYLLCICLGGYLIHLAFRILEHHVTPYLPPSASPSSGEPSHNRPHGSGR